MQQLVSARLVSPNPGLQGRRCSALSTQKAKLALRCSVCENQELGISFRVDIVDDGEVTISGSANSQGATGATPAKRPRRSMLVASGGKLRLHYYSARACHHRRPAGNIANPDGLRFQSRVSTIARIGKRWTIHVRLGAVRQHRTVLCHISRPAIWVERRDQVIGGLVGLANLAHPTAGRGGRLLACKKP